MSTWRYCTDPTPHEMHEWYLSPRSEPWNGGGDWFHCPGVKDGVDLAESLATLARMETEVGEQQLHVRELAKRNRRTISEAMNCAPEHAYSEPDTLHTEQEA
jgi:hypothetical protein